MSARVEGASEFQVLRRIVVPLAKPVLLMGVILIAISAWGDYIGRRWSCRTSRK